MAEESVWIIESWETWWSLNEWVSEADVQRVQEQSGQIKKIAKQIQQDKKANNQLAEFLTFLLREISNENIVNGLYNTFFITVDPKTNIPYFRKSMNDMVVVWLFYPFFIEKAKELWVSQHYESLNHAGELSVNWYIEYLQDLSNHYHDNIPINETSFIQLLVEILKEYLCNASDMPKLDKENPDDTYKQLVYEKLYLVDGEWSLEESEADN